MLLGLTRCHAILIFLVCWDSLLDKAHEFRAKDWAKRKQHCCEWF